MRSVRFFCVFMLLVAGFTTSGRAVAQVSVWGLRPPDSFTVETTVDQTTTITLEGSEPVTTSKTETLRVEYRAQRVLPAETLFYAVVSRAESGDEATAASGLKKLKLLEQLPAKLAVDKAGIVRNVDGHRELLHRIGDVDSNMMRFLERAYPQEVFSAWIGRPFWLAVAVESPEKETTWERIDNLSLGMMGSFRTIAECRVSGIEEGFATITISGEGRHVAPPPVVRPLSQSVAFRDVNVNMKTFAGIGKMWLPSPQEKTDDDQARSDLRPGFESLSLTWEFEGSASAKAGTKTVSVSFTESQKHTSRLLPGYRVGTQRRLREYGVPLSIPRQ